MTQKGEHTWDLYLHYHRCPHCGYIIENRENFENRFGKYVKELTCPRCKNHFVVTGTQRPSFGPLTGDPEPAEFDWNTK